MSAAHATRRSKEMQPSQAQTADRMFVAVGQRTIADRTDARETERDRCTCRARNNRRKR